MESFWTGSISLREGDIADDPEVQLFNGRQGHQIPTTSKLSFLSFVDCSQIPLYIICGPSYEVIGSRCWIQDRILDSLPEKGIQDDSHAESETGALLQVVEDGTSKRDDDDMPDVTELLMYARVEDEADKTSGSPDTAEIESQISHRRVRFYALPLSSNLVYSADRYSTPPTPPPESHCSEISGTFLQQIDINSFKKRKRLNSLFDEATKPRKRPKRQDSHDLARLIPSRPGSPLLGHEGGSTRPQRRPSSSTHSRAHSVGSLHEEKILDRGHTLVRARSSLSRVASISVLSRPSSRGTDIHTPDDKASNIDNKNKKTLSLLIMAGMRMRGMSQRKQESKLVADDSEYKLMYHNTFKAASFALRDRMKEDLEADSMRDVVDVLLDLFCGGDNGSAGFDVSHQKACLNDETCCNGLHLRRP